LPGYFEGEINLLDLNGADKSQTFAFQLPVMM
jgi:hypothetical protein